MIVRTTRSAIKAYMVDRIKTQIDGAYPTLAADKVFRDRFGPLQSEELPAIMLFAADETSEMLDVTQDRRQLKLQIEIQADGDDADTQLDVISDQIEDLFRNDEYLGGPESGLVEWCRYTHGQLTYDPARHVNCLCWTMDFDVRYLFQTAPDSSVSRMGLFREMDATYAFTEGDPRPPVEIEEVGSVVTIPQD